MGGSSVYDNEEDELDLEKMEIFPNVGKFEKKTGLAASDKEIFVVNKLIAEDLDNLRSLVNKYIPVTESSIEPIIFKPFLGLIM